MGVTNFDNVIATKFTGDGAGPLINDNSNGGNNAICASLWAVGTSVAVSVTTGTRVAIKLGRTLQKGTNTLNLNGTTKNIVNSTNGLSLTTGYGVGGIIEVIYTPGIGSGVFQDLKQ